MPPSEPRPRRRAWLILPPALAGLAIAALLAARAEGPAHGDAAAPARAVRVIEARPMPVVPVARGFGVVEPGETWQAVAEVSGDVVFRDPRLEEGAILSAGTRLLEIDPTAYGLAVAEIEADIAARRAQLDELAAEEENTRATLAIERERLELAERDLQRKTDLRGRGAASEAQLDEQRTVVLQQRRAVQEMENALRLLPSRVRRLEAEITRDEARLRRAEDDLDSTLISAPYDIRVASVAVERDQFVPAGTTMVTAYSVDVSEVPAQMPLGPFRRVIGSVLPDGAIDVLKLQESLDTSAMTAAVRLRGGGETVTWPARVARVGDGLDPVTRTVSLVVAVDEPYRSARPPEHPPLVKNMYVEVTVAGQPLKPAIVVPRGAVHDGRVYVADADDRLVLRPVTVAFEQGGMAVIAEGLEEGERVVVDDLVPAVAGTRLAPQPAPELQAGLAAAAAGPGAGLSE